MNWDEEITQSWKELSFYYRLDEYNKQWWLIGGKTGLLNFAAIIEEYIVNSQSKSISEHIHLDWYQYLKISTSDAPIINKDGIEGSLNDIKHLKNIIIKNLDSKKPGEIFSIGKDYKYDGEFSMKFW